MLCFFIGIPLHPSMETIKSAAETHIEGLLDGRTLLFGLSQGEDMPESSTAATARNRRMVNKNRILYKRNVVARRKIGISVVGTSPQIDYHHTYYKYYLPSYRNL